MTCSAWLAKRREASLALDLSRVLGTEQKQVGVDQAETVVVAKNADQNHVSNRLYSYDSAVTKPKETIFYRSHTNTIEK